MSDEIWHMITENVFWFSCLGLVQKTGCGPQWTLQHYYSWSYEKNATSTSAYQRCYNLAQGLRLTSLWQSFLEASTRSWTSHSPYSVVSAVMSSRFLSTFQATCHQAGIFCSKHTSNTSKSDSCLNAEQGLHHLHSAGRHYYFVHELCARNSSLWGLRMIWAVEGNEEKGKT